MMSTLQPKSTHLVYWEVPFWAGHASAHALIGELLEMEPDLRVAFVYHAALTSQVQSDFARSFPQSSTSRITFLPIGTADLVVQSPLNWPQAQTEMVSQTIPALKAGAVEPSRFILSQFGGNYIIPFLKSVWPGKEIWMHWCSCAGWLNRIVAPAPYGAGSYKRMIGEAVKAGPLTPEQIQGLTAQMLFAKNGTTKISEDLVKVPGLSDMYHYEIEAANNPTPLGLALLTSTTCDTSSMVTGTLVSTSLLLEQEMSENLSKSIKASYLGIVSNPRTWNKQMAFEEDSAVKAFLDQYQDDPRGVVFVSFGTNYWPQKWGSELIRSLIALDRPFILASSIPNAIGDDLVSEITAGPNAYLFPGFIDQISVLSHPAVHWHVTHGGWNSLSESLIIGVPTMIWPLAHNDQPYNAALLSTRSNPVAFEFLQIREEKRVNTRGVVVEGTADAVNREFQDVLQRSLGEEGKTIAKNAKILAAQLKEEKRERSMGVVRALFGA